MRHLIEGISEFDDEMTKLLETIQLTEFEIKTRYDVVCGHLEDVFKSIFPQCRLYRFGSTMAGLAFKDSDLDMYMHIGDTGTIGKISSHFCTAFLHVHLIHTMSRFKVHVRRITNQTFRFKSTRKRY